MTALNVYLHSERAGVLERLSGAQLEFRYDPEWVDRDGSPLSLSLAVRAEPFADAECRPFFEGLLPEGDFLRAIARAFHVSADNPFALLGEIGGECAGAVSLSAEGLPARFASAPPVEWLSEQKMGEILDKLPSRPLLAGERDGIRLSLAGTQDKLPVLGDGERIGLTRGAPPSTHIIKTPLRRFEDSVANEAFCMRLAAALGLRVARVAPRIAAGREFLLVTRYDRQGEGDEVQRIHQEDLCQALGYPPATKYQAEGGPGVADCARLLYERAAAPAVDLLAFLDALLFNLLIGNHDAHAKNFSLLLEGPGTPRLAPLYDLLCAAAYEGVQRKLAMKYGGEYRPGYVRRRHLDRLAADLEVSPRTVRDRAQEMSERIGDLARATRAELPSPWQEAPILDKAIDWIEAGARQLSREAAS